MKERPDNSNLVEHLIGFIFFLGPFVFLRSPSGLNIYLVDLLICITAILSIMTAMFNRSLRIDRKLFGIIGIIFLGYLASSMGAIDMERSLVALSQYCFIFLLLLLINLNLNNEQHLFKLVRFYLLGTTIVIAISLLIYNGVVEAPGLRLWVAGRFCGVWENPNIMAKQMYIYIVVLFAYVLYVPVTKKALIASMVMIFLAGYLILTSASFGGVVFLTISLLALILIYTVNKGIKTVAYFSLFMASISIIFVYVLNVSDFIEYVPARFVSRVLDASSLKDAGSAVDKYTQILFGMEMFLRSPFLGVGLENGIYHNSASEEYNIVRTSFHSFYVAAPVEGGVLVALGFGLLFLYFFRSSGNVTNIKLMRYTLLATFMISLIVSNNIYNRYLWIPFAVLAMTNSSLKRRKIYD